MSKILHYISFICVFICLWSCHKKQDLTTNEVPKNDSIEQQNIVVLNELLAIELHKIKTNSSSVNLKNKDSVLAFYKSRNGKAAWENLKNRNDLYIAVKNAGKEGLTPSDYNIKQLEKTIPFNQSKNSENVIVDLVYTDTYLTFAYHLANGKINPKKLYNDWDLTKNIFHFNNILNQSLENDQLAIALNNFKPQHAIYKHLKTELQHAKPLVNKDSLRTIVVYGNKIRPNQSNGEIINIRKRLNELGFLNDSLVNQSKILDTLLQHSLKKFQLEKNLQVDAIIGESTVNALNRSYKDDYLSILANLERWRWFPRSYGETAIVVNIPQYQLTYITPKENLTHKIIVGKTARRTPVFSSVVKHIDFNPLWYIPPTIKKEDIIPSATKDIDYLRKKNITVYNSKGKQMVLDSINWSSNAPLSYRYVQAAGDSNALGRLKIIFPNDFSVYLHDTPSKSLFGKNYRAKSSGCVRVQNVFSLASKVLDWNEDKVTSTVDSGSTKRIFPKKEVNVHFLYWSVVFNDNLQPIFLNDVYDLDNELGEKLAN